VKPFSIVKAKQAGYGLNLVPIYGSSALAAWSYDSTTEVFEVVFHSGIVKRYRLPIPTVNAFRVAKSKGSFYNREIKFKKLAGGHPVMSGTGEGWGSPSPGFENSRLPDCSASTRARVGNLREVQPTK
jgi:KTSC domain